MENTLVKKLRSANYRVTEDIPHTYNVTGLNVYLFTIIFYSKKYGDEEDLIEISDSECILYSFNDANTAFKYCIKEFPILYVVSTTYFINGSLNTNLLGVFSTLTDAQIAKGNDYMDHIHNIENGKTKGFSSQFGDLTIEDHRHFCLIQDPNTGNRILWEINYSLLNKSKNK